MRCTQYLTSSQALTLNFLGPLYAARGWLLRTLSSLLGRSDVLDVEFAGVEHAPIRRSQFLGDMTRVDAFIIIRCSHGYEAIVLEFKYADRFNSRDVQIFDQPKYRALATETAMWKNFEEVAVQRKFNQLVRCHALGAAMLQHETPGGRLTTLLAVHHEKDARASQLLADYRSHMSEPARAGSLTLADLCDHMAKTANVQQLEAVEALRTRYANETASEHWWQAMVRA